jgi:hypothetical protein
MDFTRHKITTIILLLAALLTMAVLAAPYVPKLIDFDQTFYPAIRYALHGENPYTAAYQVTDQGVPPSFFSPTWLLLLLLPFGLLPLSLARSLWAIFLVSVTLAASLRLKTWGITGLWPILLLFLPWSLIGILYGQVTAVLLLGTILCLAEIRKPDQSYRSGLVVLLGFALIGLKPQLGGLVAIPLLLEMAGHRDKRLLVVAIGGSILLLCSLVVMWPWLTDGPILLPAPHWLSTLERELTLWHLPLWMAWIIRAVVVLVMSLWAWRERPFSYTWWSAWLTAVLIITPYTRGYDGVLLLPVLGLLFKQSWIKAMIFVVVVILYTTVSELGSIVTPLAAWILFVPWQTHIISPLRLKIR